MYQREFIFQGTLLVATNQRDVTLQDLLVATKQRDVTL